MSNLKLALGILSISSLVAVGNGFNFEDFRSKRQVEEFTTRSPNSGGGNCQFPRKAFRCDCCTMPDEILGNFTASFRKCFGKKWDEYRNNKNQYQNQNYNHNHHNQGRWEGKSQYSAKQEIGPEDEGGYYPESSTPDYTSGERPEGRPGGPGGRGPGGPGGSDGPGDSDEFEGPGGQDGSGRPGGPGERGPGGSNGSEGPGGPGGRGPGGSGGSDGPGGSDGSEGPGGPGGRGPGGSGGSDGPGGSDGSEGPEGPGGRGPGGSGGSGGRRPGGPGGQGPGGPGGRGPGGPGGRGGSDGEWGPGGPGGPGGRGPGGRGPPGQGPDCDHRRGRGRGHHFRGGQRDGCLLECVFQEENWLENSKVNVDEILKRIESSKNDGNSKWVEVALVAAQDCAKTPAEEGKKCQSGAEEFYMCMGRKIFLNCPEFKDEIQECNTLRDFYENSEQCPTMHPVPLRCHQHGTSEGKGEEPMRQRGPGPQRYHDRNH